jgi:hypothetical protein
MELNYAGSAVREVPAHRILGNLESKENYTHLSKWYCIWKRACLRHVSVHP